MHRDKCSAIFAIVVLVGLLGLFIGWIGGALSSDIDSDVCGTVDYLPNKFVVTKQWFATRRNMDVLEHIDDPEMEVNGTKIGEYYRKIIAFPQHYRFVDKHNHIAATMRHKFFTYTHRITRCDSSVQYEIRQHFITWGLFETAYNLYRREQEDQEWEFIGDVMLETFLGRRINITQPNTTNVLGEVQRPIQFLQESWVVNTHSPSTIEPYVAGFFAVLVTNEEIDRQNSRNNQGLVQREATVVPSETKQALGSVVGAVESAVGAAKLAVGLGDANAVHPARKAGLSKGRSGSLQPALVPAL